MRTRLGYTLGLLVCAGLLAFALYLQYVEHQDPCPLCILQRIVFIAMMVLYVLAAFHDPLKRGAIAYSALLVVLAGTGAAIAARQVWLQHLPANLVPACGPGFSYMIERFPLYQALEKILAGSGECAEAGWTFLGLTIAGWSLVWFVILGIFSIMIAANAPRERRAPSAQ